MADPWKERSQILSPPLWANNASYLSTIPPRLSKYARLADDATIQFHLDTVGVDNIGIVDGNLTPCGNLAAMMYPDALPDRLGVVAYMLEAAFFWDDLNCPEPDESTVKDSVSNSRREAHMKGPVWKEKMKQAFSKAVKGFITVDPVMGSDVLRTWNTWRAAEMDIHGRFDQYSTLDEYVEDRIHDLAYPCAMEFGKFASNLKLTFDEEESVQHGIWPLKPHGVYCNDYHSWDKELKAHEDSDGKIPIINAVVILQRLHGLSVDEAKVYLKNKCFELDREYHRRKEKFITTTEDGISPSVLRLLDHCEQTTTGHTMWVMQSYRHKAPGGDGYRD
ncbi:hypothetical protein MW887_004505 [Aspergillus wentii]|nr:hypothetical protein MW887_004505 [Aspergillus wentii]